ncbi:hypothetical protein LQK93_02134 [Terrabacter sp. BE26]
MRRLVAPLLAVGAALLVAALVWPTERLETAAAGGSVPLLDIWLWGRVRSLSELSTTHVDGSLGTLAVLATATVLALVAGVLWLTAVRRQGQSRLGGTVAAVAVVGALAAAAVGLTVMTAGLGFGWYSPGEPTFTLTAVAAFPPVAIAVWAVALVLMVVLLLRGGSGPDEAPDGASDG